MIGAPFSNHFWQSGGTTLPSPTGSGLLFPRIPLAKEFWALGFSRAVAGRGSRTNRCPPDTFPGELRQHVFRDGYTYQRPRSNISASIRLVSVENVFGIVLPGRSLSLAPANHTRARASPHTLRVLREGMHRMCFEDTGREVAVLVRGHLQMDAPPSVECSHRE